MSGVTIQRLVLGAMLAAGMSMPLQRLMAADKDDAAKTDSAKTDAAKPEADKPKSARSVAEIMKDFQEAGQSLSGVLSSPAAIVDEDKRNEAAPKVIGPLKKMMTCLRELKDAGDPQGPIIASQMEPQLISMLAVFGDSDTIDALKKQAGGSDQRQALQAKGALLLADWVKAHKDAKAQVKLAEQAEALARDNPDNEPLTQQLMALAQLGPASPELRGRVEAAATGMKTPAAQQIKAQVDAGKKLRSMENKPLTIAGAKNDGGKFTSADWKGKVILVDFWATWCGPCRAELPRVKKAYADFHDKGLEVLGVSCDNSGDDLGKFLKANPDMPWPQLFNAATAGWHPLATEYGINGIPTMFLIDKKGVLRTVEAREDFETQIPKLLAEKE